MLSNMDMIRECVVPREQLHRETRESYISGYNCGVTKVISTLQEDYELPQELVNKLKALRQDI